ALLRLAGGIPSVGPGWIQDCATRPCPLFCKSLIKRPRPPLSTLPAAAPPNRDPNPPGIGLLPTGFALLGPPPNKPPKMSARPPLGVFAWTVPVEGADVGRS